MPRNTCFPDADVTMGFSALNSASPTAPFNRCYCGRRSRLQSTKPMGWALFEVPQQKGLVSFATQEQGSSLGAFLPQLSFASVTEINTKKLWR